MVIACCFLLAAAGVLLPVFHNRGDRSGPGGDGLPTWGGADPKSGSKGKTVLAEDSETRPAIPSAVPSEGSLYQVFVPFSSSGQPSTCEALLNIQGRMIRSTENGMCSVYPVWILYLALEPTGGPTPGCGLESPFGLATSAIREGRLCGRGYAFLSVYYAHKKIADRSLSFLQEAKLRSPEDPWVHLAEGLYHQKIFNDSDRASAIFSRLVDRPEVSPISRYLLAGVHIMNGDYQEAARIFRPLVETYPHQELFRRVESILFSLSQAPYYSRETAQGLLDLSRTFASMQNLPMAERLCMKVLEEMSGRLPIEERKEAYFEMGRIYEQRGDKDNAYVSYRTVLRLDPYFREAHRRIQSLLAHPSEKS